MTKSSENDVWDQDPPRSERAGSTFVKQTPNLNQAVNAKVVRDDWDDDDEEEEEEEKDVDEKRWDANANASARTKNDGTALGPRPLGGREKEAEERRGEEDSSKIWEEANKRAPMPELIVASASTGQSLAPPPPAALQPTLRILKRPSPNASANNVGAASSAPLAPCSPEPTSGSGSGSGVTSPALRGTLAEREAQYQEARNRIFGDKGCTSGHASSGSMSRTSSSSGGVVQIARDPLGPASESELDPGLGGQDRAHGPGRPAKGFGERRRGRK